MTKQLVHDEDELCEFFYEELVIEEGDSPCCCDSCGADVDEDDWECWWCGSEIL
jgi:hypothetical protein